MSKPSGYISELQDPESIGAEVNQIYLQQPSALPSYEDATGISSIPTQSFCGLNSVGNYPTSVLNQPPPLGLYNGYPHLQLFHGQSFPGASIPITAQAAASPLDKSTLITEELLNKELCNRCQMPKAYNDSLPIEMQPLKNETFGRTSQPDSFNSDEANLYAWMDAMFCYFIILACIVVCFFIFHMM